MLEEEQIDKLLEQEPPHHEKKTQAITHTAEAADHSRKKLLTMSRLLASVASREEIYMIMGRELNPNGTPGFGMTPKQCDALIHKVYSRWAETDKAHQPHLRSAARRRIYEHIQEARKDRNWNAVSNFEKVLSGIEGTQEPVEIIHHTADNVLTESLLQVLGEQDPMKVRELIAAEAKRVHAVDIEYEVIEE